jgi:HEAT repeat protein
MNRLWQFLFILLLLNPFGNMAEGCPACWAGYGPGAERFNKALADLRIMYETRGRDALPQMKKVLKTSNDPLVQRRAIEYIAELEDVNSIPLLEDVVSDLVKRVSFNTFGVGSIPFQTRLKAAHTLANLGSTGLADKIWNRYDRLDWPRKSEVPYILNALGDPNLSERLMKILNRYEDHQLMVGALDVLSLGGDEKALPFLRIKVVEWGNKHENMDDSEKSFTPVEYSVWRIKAQQAILKIEDRTRH